MFLFTLLPFETSFACLLNGRLGRPAYLLENLGAGNLFLGSKRSARQPKETFGLTQSSSGASITSKPPSRNRKPAEGAGGGSGSRDAGHKQVGHMNFEMFVVLVVIGCQVLVRLDTVL